MVRLLKFYQWAQSDITCVYSSLQMQRLGISGDRIAEPAKIRELAYSLGIVPKRSCSLKIGLAQRHSATPCERAIAVKHPDFDEAANEKVFIVDYALITVQFTSLVAHSRRKGVPRVRSIKVPR